MEIKIKAIKPNIPIPKALLYGFLLANPSHKERTAIMSERRMKTTLKPLIFLVIPLILSNF